MKQWKILEDAWIYGGIVSELILDKWVAGYSGTFRFTSDPADGTIFLIKVHVLSEDRFLQVLKLWRILLALP